MSNIPMLLRFNLRKKSNKRKLAVFVIAGLFIFLSTLSVSAKVINLGTSVDTIFVDGNLGVGTSAPSVDLQVQGNGYFSSGLQVGSQYVSGGVYSYSNGILVSTDIGVDDNAMIELYIEGNSYSGWGNIGGRVQTYNYVTTGTFINSYYVAYGIAPTEVRVFHQDGVVKFWMPQISNYQTFRFRLGANGGPFRITGIANAAMPSTGVTNEVIMTPKTVFNNNLGIGTSNPATNLDVSGTFRNTLATTHSLLGGAGNAVVMSDNTGALYSTGLSTFLSSNTLWSGTRNGNIWNGDTGAGNVGIGTSAPSQQLEITKNFRLPATSYNSGNQYGVIYKNGNRFIHDFNYGNNGTVTTDGYNTFIGEESGNFTTGSTATLAYHASRNTAVGMRTLYSNTTGYYNTALGVFSLFNNTTGYQNSALGMYSLFSNTTGYQNSALGVSALRYNTTGDVNTAVGMYAGSYIADGSTSNATGNYNVFLGSNTKALADGDSNEIVIGYNATGAGSNSVVLGNDSINQTVLKGNVGIGTSSSEAKLHISEGTNSIINLVPTLFSDAGTKSYAGEFTGNGDVSGLLITNQKADGSGYPFVQYYNKTLNDSWIVRMLSDDTYSIAEGWSPALDRLIIKTGGNVGMGTTNPGAPLEIARNTGGSVTSPGLRLNSISGGDGSGSAILWANSFMTNGTAQISGQDTGSWGGKILFWTAPSTGSSPGGSLAERMILSDTGNLGIGDMSPVNKLSVDGIAALGSGKNLMMMGFDASSEGSQTYVKIKTKIPFASNLARIPHTVHIKGFVRSTNKTVDLVISWISANDAFEDTAVSSKGGLAPTVQLSAEGGFVSIVLSTSSSWIPKVYVESYYNWQQNNYANDWTLAYEAASGSPVVTVPYKTDLGNNVMVQSTGDVGIGYSNPTVEGKLFVYRTSTTTNADGTASNAYGTDSLSLMGGIDSTADEGESYGSIAWLDAGGRRVMITSVADGTWNYEMGLAFYTHNAGGPSGQELSEKMRLTSDGNLGLGVTNPTVQFEMDGSFKSRSATHTLLGGTGNSILAVDNDGALYSTSLTMVSSALNMNSGIIRKYREVNDANTTAGSNDYIIRFTNLTANRALYLVDSNCTAGRTYVASNDENATNSLQIWPQSPTTINGQSYFSVGTAESATVYCDGSNWVAY